MPLFRTLGVSLGKDFEKQINIPREKQEVPLRGWNLGISIFLRLLPSRSSSRSRPSRVCSYSKLVEAISKRAQQRSTRVRHFADTVSIFFRFSGKENVLAGTKKKLVKLSQVLRELSKLLVLESFRILEDCEAIIDLTRTARLVCDLSSTRVCSKERLVFSFFVYLERDD